LPLHRKALLERHLRFEGFLLERAGVVGRNPGRRLVFGNDMAIGFSRCD
jgi:hypothetical protein